MKPMYQKLKERAVECDNDDIRILFEGIWESEFENCISEDECQDLVDYIEKKDYEQVLDYLNKVIDHIEDRSHLQLHP